MAPPSRVDPAEPVTAAPRSAGRAVSAGATWQLLSFAARVVAGLVAALLVARAGGPRELGTFQLALNIGGLISFLIGFGLPNLITREIARDHGATRPWLESVLLASLTSGVVLTFASGGIWWAVGGAATLGWAVVLAVAATTADACARQVFAAFWGWERMHLETIATWAQETLFLGLTVVVLERGGGAVGVLAGYLASRVLGAVVGWLLACSMTGTRLRPTLHPTLLRSIMRRSVPFAFDDLLSMAYIRVDTVLLGAMKGTYAVGLYQAGTNIVLNFNVLARMVNSTMLARMSRSYATRSAELGRLRDVSLRLLSAVGVPAAAGAVVLADALVRFLYGPGFGSAVLCFQVLALVIPVRMVGHTLGTALTSADAQTSRTWAVAVAAVGNVALNLALVPRWSYLGSAWATVGTEAGLLVAYAVLARRRVGPSALLRSLPVPLLASAPMVAVLLGTSAAGVLTRLVLGCVTYVLAFLVVAALRDPASPRSPRRAVLDYVWGTS